MATVKFEGQSIPVDDEIAADDKLLRDALAMTWPDAKNATFTRTGGGETGKPLTVLVTKKAGTKGSGLLIERMLLQPEYINPALVMSVEIAERYKRGDLDEKAIAELMPRIIRAADEGEGELDASDAAARVLAGASPVPGKNIPLGF
jgi:hypothetical protein